MPEAISLQHGAPHRLVLLREEVTQPATSLLLQRGCSWRLHGLGHGQLGYSYPALSALVLLSAGQCGSYRQGS